MSAVIQPARESVASPEHRSAIVTGDPARAIAFDARGETRLSTFLSQVRGVAAALPPGRHAINLCEDRYRFLVAFCAVAVRGQVSLLPPSRAPAVVDDVLARHPDAYCIGDESLAPAPPHYWRLPAQLPEAGGEVPPLADDALGA